MIGTHRPLTQNAVLAVSFLLCMVSAPSCKTHPHIEIHHSKTLTITLRELPTGYPSLTPFHYTHVIDPSDTLVLLESLTYESGSGVPLAHVQRHQVFTKNQAASLAPELSKALNLALPHEVAAFCMSDAEQPRQQIKGLVFAQGDELHLVIEELPRSWFDGAKNPHLQQPFRWELLPRDRQRHYISYQGVTGTMTNWIIVPIR